MIASPPAKHDTFDIEASEDHMNYDMFDIGVEKNSTKMKAL